MGCGCQRYFDKCADVEAQRLKKSQAKDDRQQEKGEKSYDYAFSEMLVAKDEFIVATDVANVAKARLYNTDLPSLHDDFQMLEISTISHLVHVLLAFTGIQAASLARLAEDNATTEGALRSISAEEDQALYVEAHSAAKLASWDIPKDLEFEECPAWHDNVRPLSRSPRPVGLTFVSQAEMSTSDTSVVYLQNVKSKATARLAEVSPIVESKRREIAGLRNLREAYEKDRSLGDAGSVLEVSLFELVVYCLQSSYFLRTRTCSIRSGKRPCWRLWLQNSVLRLSSSTQPSEVRASGPFTPHFC